MRRVLVAAVASLAGIWLTPVAPAAAAATTSAVAPGPATAANALRTTSGRCRGITVPVSSDDPVGVAEVCPDVRPGARLLAGDPNGLVDGAAYCTMNFVFRDTSGNTYVATAGHCILDSVGEYPGVTPSVVPNAYAFNANADPYFIGTFVYAVRSDASDFALIRLRNPGTFPWSAQMCFFGGPTGLNSDITEKPTPLHHFGQGFGFGELTPGRTAVAPNLQDPYRVIAAGVAFLGDSGSPVVDNTGRAIGVMVSIEVDSNANAVGVLGITRLGPPKQRAESVLRTQLSLLTAGLIS